ncbi:hypothetical protein ACUHMQ_07435 [Chitinimonas sp. PSY-7]|uniref:hypothetical protein n=1 Tax=Chitinimonas sp. PSY-7 TaxID=3459088 RepID=UPI0040402A89
MQPHQFFFYTCLIGLCSSASVAVYSLIPSLQQTINGQYSSEGDGLPKKAAFDVYTWNSTSNPGEGLNCSRPNEWNVIRAKSNVRGHSHSVLDKKQMLMDQAEADACINVVGKKIEQSKKEVRYLSKRDSLVLGSSSLVVPKNSPADPLLFRFSTDLIDLDKINGVSRCTRKVSHVRMA